MPARVCKVQECLQIVGCMATCKHGHHCTGPTRRKLRLVFPTLRKGRRARGADMVRNLVCRCTPLLRNAALRSSEPGLPPMHTRAGITPRTQDPCQSRWPQVASRASFSLPAGGVFGGTCRSSVRRRQRGPLWWCRILRHTKSGFFYHSIR